MWRERPGLHVVDWFASTDIEVLLNKFTGGQAGGEVLTTSTVRSIIVSIEVSVKAVESRRGEHDLSLEGDEKRVVKVGPVVVERCVGEVEDS